MQSIYWIWGYIKHFRFRFFSGFILALGVSVLNMMNPYLPIYLNGAQ